MSGFKNHLGSYHDKAFIKERMLSKVDYTVQELQLSPDQQAQYTAIRARMSKDMDTIASRHTTVRSSIKTEMSKEQPDIKAVAGTVKSGLRAMPDLVAAQIDSLLEVYEILDKGQQQKLIAMIKEHMNERDCF